jgi:hypothetical protein
MIFYVEAEVAKKSSPANKTPVTPGPTPRTLMLAKPRPATATMENQEY